VATRTFRTIEAEIPAGIDGYTNREEYDAWVEAVWADESMSPSDRADMISGSVEPEETFEEYMERHADE
jgi:hypothetical protein